MPATISFTCQAFRFGEETASRSSSSQSYKVPTLLCWELLSEALTLLHNDLEMFVEDLPHPMALAFYVCTKSESCGHAMVCCCHELKVGGTG